LNNESSSFELINGEQYLYEVYNEKTFRISPESFLQVNKKAADAMIRTVLTHANLDENTILVDIGAGIGKISQTSTFND
jgi:tRNA/tmRNA/rRNA uracil-C5-methylase (TrmA/RlmC/RlmD family)